MQRGGCRHHSPCPHGRTATSSVISVTRNPPAVPSSTSRRDVLTAGLGPSCPRGHCARPQNQGEHASRHPITWVARHHLVSRFDVERLPRTLPTERAIVSAMAGTRRTQDEDAISRLADAGENALRRLVDLPRRIVVGTMDVVGEQLHQVATKVRAIDPLDDRVGAIERRLDSLEQPKKTGRRASTGTKPRRARKASTASAHETEQAQHDRGSADDARVEDEREQGESRA